MQRLKTREQFQAVMAAGTVSRTPHFVLHRSPLALVQGACCAPDAPASPLQLAPAVWLGALIPKRWAKRAVTRNAIRRQIYAVSLAHQARFALAAHVVRLRAGFDPRQFVSASSQALKNAVRTELQVLFEQARPLADVRAVSNCGPV